MEWTSRIDRGNICKESSKNGRKVWVKVSSEHTRGPDHTLPCHISKKTHEGHRAGHIPPLRIERSTSFGGSFKM